MDIFWLNPMFLKTLQVLQFSVINSRIFATFVLTLTCSWTGPISAVTRFSKAQKRSARVATCTVPEPRSRDASKACICYH